MRTQIAMTAISLSLLLVAAGCGDAGGAAADDGKPLQFYLSGDANQGGGYAKMAAKYTEQTGQKIEIVDIPNADIKTKLKNAAQANDLPSMARIGSIDPIWKDATVDLKDIATAGKVKMSLAAVDDKGKVLSIPSDVTAVGMFKTRRCGTRQGSRTRSPTRRSGPGTSSSRVRRRSKRRRARSTAS